MRRRRADIDVKSEEISQKRALNAKNGRRNGREMYKRRISEMGMKCPKILDRGV